MLLKKYLLNAIFYLLTLNVSALQASTSYSSADEFEEISLTRGQSLHEIDQKFAGLYQNVPGPEDDFLRCSICMCGFWKNTSKTLSILASTGATALTSLVAIPGLLDDNTKTILSSAAAITNIVAISLIAIEGYYSKAKEDRKLQLRDLLGEYGVHVDLDASV